MKLLFGMDRKDYAEDAPEIVRPSARGIILRDGCVAMVHSMKYDYYKFPGGGIEAGEEPVDALAREVQEESGLIVKRDTVREYGLVHRVQKGEAGTKFVQDNYYYLCEVENEETAQHLDKYEEEEKFTLEFVCPRHAIEVNRAHDHGPKDQVMLEREALVLERLIQEKYLNG